ncbi:polysaccharide pyruvyl transferase family protein [uncultured Amnibacterium sp.]|uniref:polysaccharide pyruvyl transferase family protein n=1 Tax=uncultured Amnibacterium sp. TaxID=1631851 RepID=UPI0035CC1F14
MPTRRILIRSGKHPFTVLSPEATLARERVATFAGNVGNVLFMDSVTKAVSAPDVEVVPNSMITERPIADEFYAEKVNDEFDALVLPMANAFKEKFSQQMVTMTDVINKLDIPVTIVGIGAQWKFGEDRDIMPPDFHEIARAFVAAVLDHSASIGVRGEATKDFLKYLGFGDEHVDVIGCPSLFREQAPPAVRPAPAIDPGSRIAMSVTPDLELISPIIGHHVEKYPRLTYVAQESPELALALYGEPVPYWRAQRLTRRKGVDDIRLPLHWDHPLYQEDRIRNFVDATTWFDFMRTQDFAFGTRLHGTIAALVVGTPAVMITHDSRTTELADFHRMPHRPLTQELTEIDVAELAADADFTAFNAERAHGFANYLSFLEKNDIDHIFRHEGAAEAWEAELSTRVFPPAVHTLMAPEPQFRRDMAARLIWLRQSHTRDAQRTAAGAYKVPFDGGAGRPRKAPPKPKPVVVTPPPPPPPTRSEVLVRRARRLAAGVLAPLRPRRPTRGGPTQAPVEGPATT